MKTLELQNTIIRKVLDTKDPALLELINSILSNEESTNVYKLSETERKLIMESDSDYKAGRTISHDEVTKRLEKWLEE